MIIPFVELKIRHGISPEGVIQVGASFGQEAVQFYGNGVKRCIFIEAMKDAYDKMIPFISQYHNAKGYHACIWDVDDQKKEFHISNNGGRSSSLFEFDYHKIAHPEIEFVESETMTTVRLDTLLKDITGYDMLVLDIQGCEYEAIQGMGDLLDGIKYIYTEINQKPLYKYGRLLSDMDNLLHDFTRVETKILQYGWGDALYLRE
jgi:FkbM family methyltransferase